MNDRNSQYTLKAYQVLLKTNKHKRILVEGRDDRQFFMLLIHELEKCRRIDRIIVDSASDFIDSRYFVGKDDSRKGLGNREKVERICYLVSGKSYACRLIGFVDREFRGFNYISLIDEIQAHKIEGRIVWSRGHSIENYFFDRNILAETFRFYLTEEWFDKSITLFERYFESIIFLACTISMTFRDIEKIQAIKDLNFDWSLLYIEKKSNSMHLNVKAWANQLSNMKKLKQNEVEAMLEKYNLWAKRLESMDFNVVRWLCHGHIGFKSILSLFRFCIAETCPQKDARKPEKYLGNFKDEKHFNFCTNIWLSKVMINQCEHPLEALKELGFEIT